jgi:serine/threonine-protein kinase
VIAVLAQIADGLKAIHEAGIVHRDLKPANVLISMGAGEQPQVKLADFGIAKLVATEESPGKPAETLRELVPQATGKHQTFGNLSAEQSLSPSTEDSLTLTGFIIGTPMYMAPEGSDRLHSAKPAADVFSFGVIAFELLAGRLPFPRSPLSMVAAAEPWPLPQLQLRRPDLPAGLTQLIESCLARDPEARPTSLALSVKLAALSLSS